MQAAFATCDCSINVNRKERKKQKLVVLTLTGQNNVASSRYETCPIQVRNIGIGVRDDWSGVCHWDIDL